MLKKKKNLVIGGLITAVILIYSFAFLQNQNRLAKADFQKKEVTLRKKIELHAQKVEPNFKLSHQTNDKKEIFLYSPTNVDGQPIQAIQQWIEDVSKQTTKSFTKKDYQKLVILAQPNQIRANLVNYHLIAQTFTWDKKKADWTENATRFKGSILINQLKSQPLTFGDLFSSESNVLAVNNYIQQELLAKAQQEKKEIEPFFWLAYPNSTDTNFTYQPDEIIISLPENPLGLDTYTIKYENVAAFLNPDFVDEQYIKQVEQKIVDPAQKRVALSFDDGPSDKTTPIILETLRTKKVPATFFVLGKQAEQFPDLVKQIQKDGHEFGNHSYDHKDLTTLSTEEIQQQIFQTQLAVYQAAGILPQFVRPPYGKVNRATAITIGKPILMWSVDSEDWKSKNAKKIVDRVKNTADNQSIILLHDIHQETADALPTLIDELRNMGYEFVSVSELLQNQPKPIYAYYSGLNNRELTE